MYGSVNVRGGVGNYNYAYRISFSELQRISMS